MPLDEGIESFWCYALQFIAMQEHSKKQAFKLVQTL